MTERLSHEAFVDALLALEEGVGEQEYAAYRRRLSRRLADRPSLRRFYAKPHLAAAALLLLSGATLMFLQQKDHGALAPLHRAVLLERTANLPQGRVSALRGSPYAAVVESGLVVLVCTEPPVREGGKAVYPLRIERVLKDETRQRPGRFSCVFQAEARPGEEYLACISERQGAWVLDDIVRMDERARTNYLQGAERCVELLAAARSSDAAAQYQALLAPAAGGMDAPASCVFACRPDPRSSSVLLSKLQTLRTQIATENPTAVPEDSFAELNRVAEALERLNEQNAALAVVECARLSPRGRRADLYRLLPGLCRNSTAEVREQVRRLLHDEIDKRGSHPDDVRAARAAMAREPLAR